MKTACVLFDLDGTLIDTNDLVLESLKYTIKTHLGAEIEDARLYKYFGQPLVNIMADLNAAMAEQMVDTYRRYNALKHDDLVKLFPQVPETLEELKNRGIHTAVVTSKMKGMAVRGLEKFNLREYFDACIAFEDTERHKPDPEPILKALEVIGLNARGREIVMVGDSPYDIMCASNAGVTSVAVEWSIHPREVLEAQNPDFWLPEFSRLLEYL